MDFKKVVKLMAACMCTASLTSNVQATTQVINGSATTQDLKSTTPVVLTYEAMDVSDSDVTFDGVSKLTVAATGTYQVRYAVNWEINNNRRRQIKTYLLKNGSEIITPSTAYSYARVNTQAKFATNNSSVTLELTAGDFLEVVALGELGDSTDLGSGTALTRSGESVFSIEPVNIAAEVAAAGVTFEKCQVKHSPTPTYPVCPVGFESVHEYPKSLVYFFDRPGVKHAVGFYPENVEDNSWWYRPYGAAEPGAFRYSSTMACTICTQSAEPVTAQ